MRSTVTLDPDVDALIKRAMAEQGIGFKKAINDGLRRGLRPASPRRPYRITPSDLGAELVPLEHALHVAAEFEDEAILEKLRQRH